MNTCHSNSLFAHRSPNPICGITMIMTKKIKTNRKGPVDFFIFKYFQKHNNLDPGVTDMSGVRRNQKLYSVNTRNKQVYILIHWDSLQHLQHCISKDDGAGRQNAKSNTPLRVNSSRTCMCVCVYVCVHACVCAERSGWGCHGTEKEWAGIKINLKCIPCTL